VGDGVLKNSSDVFNILDPDTGGSATFSVPLPLYGTGTPTHWAAYTQLEEATHDALVNMNMTQFRAYVDEMAILRGRGPMGSITAFKGSLQISEEDENFLTYLERIGMVAEPVMDF
jgi:hypothetical protein